MDFRRESVRDLADQVRSGQLAARELVAHALDADRRPRRDLNAFVAVDGDAALSAAAAIDESVASGDDPGPLAGIPIGVKDLEDAAGFRTTNGSAAWADSAARHRPLGAGRAAGGGRLRRGGQDQHAGAGLEGRHRQPAVRSRPATPGTGPGRLAARRAAARAAIAAGMVPLATGSDGGGSIRIPSALCGLSGLKPSLGRVPVGGSEPPGLARTCRARARWPAPSVDVAYALDAVIGPDPSDLRSLPMPESSWTAALDQPHVPMAVAWSPTLGYAPLDAEVRAVCERAVSALGEAGARVIEVETGLRRRPHPDVADHDQRLPGPDGRAVPGHAGVGPARSRAAGQRRLRRQGVWRRSGQGDRRVPPAQPPAGGAVPRGAAAGHADGGGAGAAVGPARGDQRPARR